jgi:hypothetical protein
MRFGRYLTLLSLCLAGARPRAAPAAQTLELRPSAGVASVRDDVLVPLAFTGPALELDLRYGRSAGATQGELGLRGGLALLRDRFGHDAANLHGELGATVLRAVAGGWRVGGVSRLQQDLAYLYKWDDAHGYWLTAWTIGPAVARERAIGSAGVLVARADLALAALASRPPARRLNKQDALTHVGFYFDRLAADPQLLSPLAFQHVRAELGWRREPVDRAGWTFGAEARFSRARDPAPFAALYVGAFAARGWAW